MLDIFSDPPGHFRSGTTAMQQMYRHFFTLAGLRQQKYQAPL
jgi:hypothetical protein